jgi:hypothetical protein
MKLLVILALGISTFFTKGNIGEEIDYNPRLLQKELSTLTSGLDYQTLELQFPESTLRGYQVDGKFFTILCPDGSKFLAYVGRVNSCRAGGCSDQTVNDYEGDFEYFDYFILFDSLKRVKVVRVYNYEATYGHGIIVKGWLKQFIGYDGTKTLRVGKEIDSISGATISACGITDDIQLKTKFLKSLEIP